MALPSYYSTGTASVSNGGTTVTGQGTGWAGALRAGDLFGTHVGIAIRIAAVVSNTELTLAYDWPGATQTTAAYEVQIVGDVARAQETTRQLLEQLGDYPNPLAADIKALLEAADADEARTAIGAGDVVGPSSAANGNLALFDGTTGKLLKDGGTLGSAALQNIGTSGANVPLLNGSNLHSGALDIGNAYSSTGAASGWSHRAGDGVVFASRNTGGSASVALWYNPNGNVGTITLNGSSTQYATSSDERLKNFIGPYDPAAAIAIIRADPVRDFRWKVDNSYAVGWGAQTSYAVSHDLATPGQGEPGDEDYTPWGVDQGKRTPYLWAALSWALDKIDELEARLAALEAA